MNDVDPMSMTLAEIYDLPDDYFEPSERTTVNKDWNVRFTSYGGAYLRAHGRQFFTIKDDDEGSSDHDPDHLGCGWCAPHNSVWWTLNQLSHYPEESKRPHP